MIIPSEIFKIRSDFFANVISCVAITNVYLKSFLNSLKRSCKLFDVELSRFPEGSSANIRLGLLIRALATATLCFSPPESSLGLLCILLDSPK